ncbi:RNA-directed DNA polymerase from mobile element jockey [Brachionus plicatilis]|uniref:RNA-directed DNA polymerase from mobile element jockey n=1 Tax=Brachionus plicatilis TaxID=10195 RepID=A0A3M7RP61_BRAPC|nr:RNA-directed DNA polymerase from mobile element jockey [Brachionus plicatilis]
MHVGDNNDCYEYMLGDHTLEKTTKERDLGIIITNDLKWTEQSKRAASRATMIACRIKLTFSYFSLDLVNLLYKSFVLQSVPVILFGGVTLNCLNRCKGDSQS